MLPEPDVSVFRPSRPGIRKVLGDLEAEIMELVWARPVGQGSTVREIYEILYQRRSLAYTTVMNTMTRLAKKELLWVEKTGEAYVYYPNFTQEEFISRFVRRVLEDLLVSFSGPTLESVSELLDPQTRERARQLLDEINRRRATEEHP